MLKAFILMPFEVEFLPIYTGFLKPVLEQNGFDVNRADDLDSHQNILKDIVEQINQSDLIVADLTTGNPNVFYELGLAHALRKTVILVTQSIEDVPFDLRSYRLLEYNVHFAYIDQAKETLANYAQQSANGELKIGNPVTDFLPTLQPIQPSTDSTKGENSPISPTNDGSSASVAVADSLNDSDKGLLDHAIDINEGYEYLGSLMEGVTVELEDLGSAVETASDDLDRIKL